MLGYHALISISSCEIRGNIGTADSMECSFFVHGGLMKAFSSEILGSFSILKIFLFIRLTNRIHSWCEIEMVLLWSFREVEWNIANLRFYLCWSILLMWSNTSPWKYCVQTWKHFYLYFMTWKLYSQKILLELYSNYGIILDDHLCSLFWLQYNFYFISILEILISTLYLTRKRFSRLAPWRWLEIRASPEIKVASCSCP